MQIVIDIPNSTFTDLKKKQNRTEVDVAVLNGTPLSKGHGRLIDVNELKKIIKENDILTMAGFNVRFCDIDNTPTVVKADKAESEEWIKLFYPKKFNSFLKIYRIKTELEMN